MKEFNSLEEIQKYYNKETNTYNFIENGETISIKLNFCLSVKSNINACDINACDINACDINAWDINACDINACDINACNINACDINACDIKARDIKAKDINACDINAWDIKACNINAFDIEYYAICVAYMVFKCKSIKGKRDNSKHICLDNEIIIKEEKN